MISHKVFKSQLQFRFPFRIAHGLRVSTDVVYLRLECRGCVAWGEAALPPYLSETQESVISFIDSFFNEHAAKGIDEIFIPLNKSHNNSSARAALDMALWSLKSQLLGVTIPFLLDVKEQKLPPSFYTISACENENEMEERLNFGLQSGYTFFKLKLIDENIEAVVSWFRKRSDYPFAVDANQSWNNLTRSVENAFFLKENNCLLIEQPFEKSDLEKSAQFKAKSALPVFADESCQRLSDLFKIQDCFHGVNIKLMKCGGITEALKMINEARRMQMKVLIGCMSESSVGCNAAANLAPLCDYADLDGPALITNDFEPSLFV